MPKCPQCGIERRDTTTVCSVCGATPHKQASVVDDATKRCPYCGETILVAAKKCKHCGEFLDESIRQPSTAQQAPPKVVVKGKGEGCFLQTLNVGCLIVFAVIAAIVIIVIAVSNM